MHLCMCMRAGVRVRVCFQQCICYVTKVRHVSVPNMAKCY